MPSIEDLCRELNGCRFKSVSWYGKFWYFSAEKDLAIMTQYQWRLVGDRQILVSSMDCDDDETPEAFSQRVACEVTDCVIASSSCNMATGDLTLLLNNGSRIEFLNCSVGLCNWVGVLDHAIIVRSIAA
jgi:hypothetical protein